MTDENVDKDTGPVKNFEAGQKSGPKFRISGRLRVPIDPERSGRAEELLRKARERREEEIRRQRREADAATVRAAGCICRSLYIAANGFDLSDYVSPEEGAPHYEECPIALAEALLEGK